MLCINAMCLKIIHTQHYHIHEVISLQRNLIEEHQKDIPYRDQDLPTDHFENKTVIGLLKQFSTITSIYKKTLLLRILVMSFNEIRHTHSSYHNHHNHNNNENNCSSHQYNHDLMVDGEDTPIDLNDFSDNKEFDPKIRELLDDLNRYSTKINQLEQCFQEENSKFHRVLNESSTKLNKTMKKCGERHINTSRPYYDGLQKLNDLKIKCQTAALKFEKYNELYMNAKQAISNAESMFHKNMKEDDQFDQYWQEKLNIANSKFTEAKLKREEHELEHSHVMTQIRILEYMTSDMKTKNKSSIKKAKLYFDEASAFDTQLKMIKEDIKTLEEELFKCKKLYSDTMRNLESISEEIHERRAQYLAKSLRREPGVGAEIDQSCVIENLAMLQIEENGETKDQSVNESYDEDHEKSTEIKCDDTTMP